MIMNYSQRLVSSTFCAAVGVSGDTTTKRFSFCFLPLRFLFLLATLHLVQVQRMMVNFLVDTSQVLHASR